jgi:serine beta-lactamase-like protein LACTB
MESASGEGFLGFMRDEVFEPLGLRHTVPDHNDSIVVHRTEFYEQGPDGAIVNAP